MRTRPAKAVIITQSAVLAVGLGDMLRREGFEVILQAGEIYDLLAKVPCGERLLVIVHGESEVCLQIAIALQAKTPGSVVVLWTNRITLSSALEALESGVRGVLSTKLSADITLASLLQLCDGEEYQLRITPESMSPQVKVPRLTGRERQILQLVRAAANNKTIAYELRLKEGTVKVYLHRLFRKAAVNSRFELAQWRPESAVDPGGDEPWNTTGRRSLASLAGATSL